MVYAYLIPYSTLYNHSKHRFTPFGGVLTMEQKLLTAIGPQC